METKLEEGRSDGLTKVTNRFPCNHRQTYNGNNLPIPSNNL